MAGSKRTVQSDTEESTSADELSLADSSAAEESANVKTADKDLSKVCTFV